MNRHDEIPDEEVYDGPPAPNPYTERDEFAQQEDYQDGPADDE